MANDDIANSEYGLPAPAGPLRPSRSPKAEPLAVTPDDPPGFSGPKVLIIRILEACNAGCFMCSFRWSRDVYRYPSSEARALAQELEGGSIRVIRLTGGEPLLHEDVDNIISVFNDHGLLTSVITNGALLHARCDALIAAGLHQVIVSLDGGAPLHDRFRNAPGLFDAAVRGITRLQNRGPRIKIRVNTVVGPHNFSALTQLYDFLCSLGVDAWSLIPLKDASGAWSYQDRAQVEEAHKSFLAHVGSTPHLRILGHGLHWIGRDADEIDSYFIQGRAMTPHGRCELVKLVRYYVPSQGHYFVCNCVPHRIGAKRLAQKWSPAALTSAGLGETGEWLRQNGPRTCAGCEPINAALGEGATDLALDPLSF